MKNIYIEYDQWGRMGNRIFQYAFAQTLGFGGSIFDPVGIPNFGIKQSYAMHIPLKPLYTKSFGNNYVDMNKILAHEEEIVVNSFLQKSIYYFPQREMLKQKFNIKDKEMINLDKLILHIRETDYKDIGIFLGYDFYKKLINNSGFGDIIIVTDNSKCETVQKLVSEGCKLHSDGYVNKFETVSDDRSMNDFNLLLNSANIALSQSSFSWWAAFFGNHKKIIFPYKSEGGLWPLNPKQDDIDLYFDYGQSQKFII